MACAKRFINGFIEILDVIGPDRREFNSEFLLLYTLLVFYKVEDVNSNRDVCALLKHCMDCIDKISSDPQHLYKIVSKAESYFKRRRSKLLGSSDDNDIAKKFAKMLQRGDLKKAVRFLTNRDGGRVLSSKEIDSKSNQTVEDVMRGKYPPMRDVNADLLKEYDEVPKFQDVVITGDTVERVAKKLSGSGGLVNFDLIAMKRLLLNHGGHSA